MNPWPKTTLVLWLGPFVLEALILGAMWIRRLHRELPIFFAYVAYHVLRTIVLFSVARSLHDAIRDPIYYYAYVAAEIVSVGLGFAVLYEVFQAVLRSYAEIQRIGKWLFAWAAVLATALAVITVIDHGHEPNAYMTAFIVLERSVRVVQAGLLLFLFAFARSLGLTWKNCVLGIAIGFSFFVGTELAIVTWRMRAGTSNHPVYSLLTQLSYLCAQFIWVCYFLQPEPQLEVRLVPDSRGELARWNNALQEFLYSR